MGQALHTDQDLTTLLQAWREGDGAAFSGLIDRVYAELKIIAARRLAQYGGEITLSSTELLHEALLRVIPGGVDFKNRAHFFATLSLSIRALLIDHARARMSQKRGGGLIRVTWTGADHDASSDIANLLMIEQALTELERLDPRCGQVVHLTYFGGLEQAEIALLLNVSVSSVTRDLRFARDWIAKELRHDT
jgi:RNA polymerase sigma factor (TIGR02999 family)